MDTNSIQKSNKIEWIYFAKGIGIILVVIGHSFRDEMILSSRICELIYNFIYFFHMPLFFTISGYLTEKTLKEKNNIKSFIDKRIKTIFVPFISYSAIIYLAFFIIYQIPAFSSILNSSSYQLVSVPKYILSSFNCSNPYAFHLWYLLVLFIVEMASMLCFKLLKMPKTRLTILIIISVIAYMIFSRDIINIYIVNVIFHYTFFFVLGQVIYYKNDIIIFKKNYIIDIAAVISIIAAVFYSANSLKTKSLIVFYISNLLLLFARVFIIVGIIRLSSKIKNSKIISYLGKQSFIIYLLHQPINAFTGIVLYKKLQFSIFAVIIVCTVISFALPLLYMLIVRKIKVLNKISKALINI